MHTRKRQAPIPEWELVGYEDVYEEWSEGWTDDPDNWGSWIAYKKAGQEADLTQWPREKWEEYDYHTEWMYDRWEKAQDLLDELEVKKRELTLSLREVEARIERLRGVRHPSDPY